ncbi:MAG: MerR family transcriptional regulator [Candidatus Methylumidiphilus sp.]
MTVPSDHDPLFGIGAVSRLTGIPLDTLRMWERRYRLVTPQRTDDNKRQYSRADVSRLALIKQLVDVGHAIGGLAALPEQALRERLQVHRDTPGQSLDDTPLRALVFGDALPVLLAQAQLGSLQILRSHAAFAEFERDALAEKPDVLIVEAPVLYEERVAELQQLGLRLGPHRLVVVYGFAMRDMLERLRKSGAALLKAPADPAALVAACRPGLAPPSALADEDAEVAPRRFDGATLAALANMPNSIRCECPQHLADLLFRLNAFEAYSADCENRNAQDAAVHAHLHRATGQARALLENALAYVIEREEIAVPLS